MKKQYAFLDFVNINGTIEQITTEIVEKEKLLFRIKNDYQNDETILERFEKFIPIKRIYCVELISESFFTKPIQKEN